MTGLNGTFEDLVAALRRAEEATRGFVGRRRYRWRADPGRCRLHAMTRSGTDDGRSLRRAGNPRAAGARARSGRAAVRARSRMPSARPAGRRHLAGVDPRASTAARRSRGCRCCASPTWSALQKDNPPFGGFNVTAAGQGPQAADVAGTDLRAGRRGRRTSTAPRARCSPPAFAPATSSTTPSPITSRPAPSFSKSGLHALGCAVVPGGVGNTEQQIEAIAHFRPAATPARRISSRCCSIRRRSPARTSSSLKRALVSGAALPPSLREELATRGVDGAAVLRHRRGRRHRLRDARRARAWSSTSM